MDFQTAFKKTMLDYWKWLRTQRICPIIVPHLGDKTKGILFRGFLRQRDGKNLTKRCQFLLAEIRTDVL